MTRIGEWVVDPHHNELRRKGESIRLEPKVIEVFMQLAARPGTAVSRDELLAAVWPGVIVGDDALTQAIIKLRKALGDDAHKPTYIETISKRGYRLIAPVEPDCAEGAPKAGAASPRRAAILVLAIAAAGLVIALAVVSARMPWPLAPDTKGAASASIPIVAVLPLENLSGDAKRDYLTDGITEDIINGLGRFSGVRVMSRNAVQALRGEAATMKAIRAEIPARYVVQGSVREADGLLRVAIELSHVERAEQLWSERYEGAGTRLFEIQDRIVRDIVGKLQVRLTQIEAQRAFAKPTGNLEAHDLLLRARFLLKRNERGANREARELLARAAQLAPDYPEIYAVSGHAEFQRATDGWIEDAEAATRRAEELAKRALSIGEPSGAHASAHSLLASIYGHQNRYDEALAQAARAIELNPSDSTALYWRGSALMCVGRIDEAIAVLETARRYEPYPSAGSGLTVAIAYYVAGRPADSLMQADALLARNPRNGFLHAARAASLAQLGRMDEATRAAGEVRRFNPVFDADNFGTRFADPRYNAMLRDGLKKAGL